MFLTDYWGRSDTSYDSRVFYRREVSSEPRVCPVSYQQGQGRSCIWWNNQSFTGNPPYSIWPYFTRHDDAAPRNAHASWITTRLLRSPDDPLPHRDRLRPWRGPAHGPKSVGPSAPNWLSGGQIIRRGIFRSFVGCRVRTLACAQELSCAPTQRYRLGRRHGR